MKTQETTLDNLLKKFVSTDQVFKSQMCKPSYKDGYVYATDAHILIRVPEERLMDKYEEVSNYPNCERVLMEAKKSNKTFIKAEAIKELLSKIKKYDVFKECATCEGESVYECECCGQDVDCDDCVDGYTDIKVGINYNPEKDLVKIGEAYFNPEYLEKLLLVCQAVGGDLILYKNQPNLPMYCEVEDIDFIIMPRKRDPLEEINIHELV